MSGGMDATREPFRAEVEGARLVTTGQEAAVLTEAYRRRPTPALRARLARALLVEEFFDDVVALLAPEPSLSPAEIRTLLHAHMSRETVEDDRMALALTQRALAGDLEPKDRAQFLADQAKVHRRLGNAAGAHAALDQALRLDPSNKDACKRLASLRLASGDAAALLVALDDLSAKGAAHARLQAARALAHAANGQVEAARAAVGFDALHHAALLETPDGSESLAAFNAALAAELLAHPGLRFDRYGTASEQTWRIDTPLLGQAPMVRTLLAQIAKAVERHVATLAAIDHPWIRSRPDEGVLHCWCVLTDGAGHETWHVHQFGWLSGVYYVQIPPSVTAGDDQAGCIAFGLPADEVGEAAATQYGLEVVRPREGLLMLFPSHTYHRTFAHGAAERRICVAFDIWPA